MPKRKSGLSKKPIGIFDSGLGGLTVFKEIRRILPGEDLIYFGDTARVPYGTKSPETIKKFAIEIAGYFKQLKVKAVVVACNTVSSLALEDVKKYCMVPVIDVIKPGAIEAANNCVEGKIAVIGTQATVNSKSYEKELKNINPSFKIISKACPLFVPLVEEGWAGKKVSYDIAKEYLSDIKKQSPQVIILGCTHYPMLLKEIASILPKVKVVNSAQSVAKFLRDELSLLGCIEKNGKGKDLFYVSDAPEKFSKLSYDLLGIKTGKVFLKRF